MVKEVNRISNSWERPKIKIAKTKSELVWDLIGYTFYLGSIIFLIFNWQALPAEVPVHFNAVGEVDRWGSKIELLILPVLGVFVAGLMHLFEKYPETHNYPERIKEENAEEFYLISRKIMNQLKNICLIIFALISFESITIALGWENQLGIWLIPIIIGSVAIPIVYGVIKQKKII